MAIGEALTAGCCVAGAADGASSAEKAAVTSETVSKVVITVSFMEVLSVLSDVEGIGCYRVWTGAAMVAGEGRPVNHPLTSPTDITNRLDHLEALMAVFTVDTLKGNVQQQA